MRPLWARATRRLHEDKRWGKEAVSLLKGTPWAQAGDDEEKPIGTPIDLLAGEERRGLPPQRPDGPSVVRRVHLKKGDFEERSVRR
eukprot:1852439-Heterocapsa_arctica.AAC.1